MRSTLRRLTVLLAGLLVLGLVAPAATSARPAAAVKVRGGTTTLVTAAGLANGLLGAKIVAFATSPGTMSLTGTAAAPRLVARYPVTGGAIVAKTAAGSWSHSGGLLLENLGNGKSVAVDRFVVNTRTKLLTARIVGTTTRLSVFSLGFKNVRIAVAKHSVTITRVSVTLLKSAADGLNLFLGTTVFKGGMLFGAASSRLTF